jgi:protein-arginine kinase activator protein McsA
LACGREKQSLATRLTDEKARQKMLAAGLEPLDPYVASRKKWKSKCLYCGRVCHPRHSDITSSTHGCPECSRKFASNGRRVDPQTAEKNVRKFGLEPLEPYTNNATRWKCIHKECGEIVWVLYGSVRRGQGICPKCTKKKGSSRKITIQAAESIMIQAGFKPLEPYRHANYRWKSRHLECGRVTFPRFADIKRSDKKRTISCTHCANKSKAAKMRLPESKAIKVMVNANLKPLVPYKSANSRWKSECLQCGNTVYPRYSTIFAGRGGCSTCASRGISLSEPAYFYVMQHSQMGALKVGIGNPSSKPDRIASHSRRGWTLLKKYDFDLGRDAVVLEKTILRWIRKELGLPPFLNRSVMQNGHTETAELDSIDLPSLFKRIDTMFKGSSRKSR